MLLLHTFNGPFAGTTGVSRYQKGKTNVDFTEARDSEWQWHQLSHNMQVCTSLQTDNHASTPPLTVVFDRPDALPAAQPTASKHRRQSLRVLVQLKSARRRRQRVSAASDIVMVFEMQQQQQQQQRRRLRLSHHGRSRSHMSIHDDTATQPRTHCIACRPALQSCRDIHAALIITIIVITPTLKRTHHVHDSYRHQFWNPQRQHVLSDPVLQPIS